MGNFHTVHRPVINNLASYHDSVLCDIVQTRHASSNICIFGLYEASLLANMGIDAWSGSYSRNVSLRLTRKLIRGSHSKICVASLKLPNSAEPRRHVRDRTSIPVPQGIGYTHATRSPIGLAFMTMEYVGGTTLHALRFLAGERWEYRNGSLRTPVLTGVHDQLVEAYAQLCRLEFLNINAHRSPTLTDKG